MDKTALVQEVAHLFRISGHSVQTSVAINHREIDVVAQELQGLVRKTILIECADYGVPVGVKKLQDDVQKLEAAREVLRDRAILHHVSRHGYSPDAAGYANDRGLPACTIEDLRLRLINFDPYIQTVESDPIRPIILHEYQPTRISFERGLHANPLPALEFFDGWIGSPNTWLTLLGDYGVGKSWTLKRLLYHLIDRYKADPHSSSLPFFVPLQYFTKAFDFRTLILSIFARNGLSGAHYEAFRYLAAQRRIVFLMDSFDEMAQHLSRSLIRQNLNELLAGIGAGSKAVMTSRPTYFENRAERLIVVERDGGPALHQLDEADFQSQNLLAKAISDRLQEAKFARLHDLSVDQRKRLFKIVLGDASHGYNRLMELFQRFQNLESISQRAVIARLLTTVAETLATAQETKTIEGYPLLPSDLGDINEGKIFEIVVYNLLQRDQSIGELSAAKRLYFLRALAVQLQRRGADRFIDPGDLRQLVERLFKTDLRRTDAPEALLDAYYRTCRRHSGLTTEGQFLDTSGRLDIPVDEADTESRVGFSHNSLREYLVAEALASQIGHNDDFPDLWDIAFTETIGGFLVDRAHYMTDVQANLARAYRELPDSRGREILFRVCVTFAAASPSNLWMFGAPPRFWGIDLSGSDLSNLNLRGAQFEDCVAEDTDLRGADLREARFDSAILEKVLLDGAQLAKADFRQAEVQSIYVFDEFQRETSAVLMGREARQWLFSRGAVVYPTDDLNPLLGNPWYHSAREVAKTLKRRIAGTHKQISLAKGSSLKYRHFASEFVDYLRDKGMLEDISKASLGGGSIVKLKKEYRTVINSFADEGTVDARLLPFFEKHGLMIEKVRK